MNANTGCLPCVALIFSLLIGFIPSGDEKEITIIEETTITTTTTEDATTETTTETTTEPTTTTTTEESLLYLGKFTATYYRGDYYPCNGGSGRELIPCDVKPDSYKGSVASRLVFERYGYYVSDRTMIYISFESIPELDGWYSVDDCNADPSIIDFYFNDYSKCPWQQAGVVLCEAWIKN